MSGLLGGSVLSWPADQTRSSPQQTQSRRAAATPKTLAMQLTVTRTTPPDSDEPVELHVRGCLDIGTRDALVDEASKAMVDAHTLRIDASRVAFIDGSGVSALVEIASRAKARGVTFDLTGRSEPLQRVLDLVGLGEAWP